jgi:hypothetical protein
MLSERGEEVEEKGVEEEEASEGRACGRDEAEAEQELVDEEELGPVAREEHAESPSPPSQFR